MHHNAPLSLPDDPPRSGQIRERSIVVSPHSLDRCEATQRGERFVRVDVTGVQDEVDSLQYLEESSRQLVKELGTMRVRDHAHPHGHAGRITFDSRGIVSRTIRGARLNKAAMPNTTGWPAPNAAAPMSGPITPPT